MVDSMSDTSQTYLFDLYGVLLKDFGRAQFDRVDRVVGEPGKTERLFQVYQELRPALDAGRVTEINYWNQIRMRAGLPNLDAIEAIAADYRGLTEPHQEVIDFVLDLKRSGHRVGILSNIPAGLAKNVRAAHDEWLNQLDAVNFSCDIDAAKPEPKAFHIAVESLNVSAADIIFIDDREVNVAAAQEVGLHAFHFTTLAALKTQLT